MTTNNALAASFQSFYVFKELPRNAGDDDRTGQRRWPQLARAHFKELPRNAGDDDPPIRSSNISRNLPSKNCPATQGMMTRGSACRAMPRRCAHFKELPRNAGDDDSGMMRIVDRSRSLIHFKELPRNAGDDDS